MATRVGMPQKKKQEPKPAPVTTEEIKPKKVTKRPNRRKAKSE